jgi:hypothetical protein
LVLLCVSRRDPFGDGSPPIIPAASLEGAGLGSVLAVLGASVGALAMGLLAMEGIELL